MSLLDGGSRHGPAITRYVMREKLAWIGDDPWIEDEHGHKVFRVDAAMLRLHGTLRLQDHTGREMVTVQGPMLKARDTLAIERNGREVARVRKALVSPLRDRFDVDLADGDAWQIQGNVLVHEYEIGGRDGRVADVSRKWFRIRDSYGVEVHPGRDDALVLAVVSAVDEMRRH